MTRACAVLGAAALAVAIAGPANGSVQVGNSGWQWGNPQPQGNTINALSFSGANGYAVGDYGTVLSTTDGGSTWTGRKSGTSTDLTEVQAITPTAFFAGGGCVGRLSSDGGATFTRVAFTSVESSCPEDLAAAWFLTSSQGFLSLEDGSVLFTDDSGTQFASKEAVPGTKAKGGSATPTDMVFFSATEGLVSTSDGTVYRTTDGASTWLTVAAFGRKVVALTTGPNLVPGGTSVFAMGASGLIRESLDGGITWLPGDRFTVPDGLTLSGGVCPAAVLCVFTTQNAAGDPTENTVRWVQGPPDGVTKVAPPSSGGVRAVGAASALRIISAGGVGTTAVSDDGGATYTRVGSSIAGVYTGLVAGPGSSAFAFGENGKLATTVNGGVDWTAIFVPSPSELIDASFASATVGYALDEDGGLFRTGDGGVRWRTLDLGTTTPADSILATDADTLFVAGPVKTRLSTDGGETFEVIGKLKKSTTGGIDNLDDADGTVFAYGEDTLWRSTNDGDSWKQIKLPPTGSGCAYKTKCSGVSSLKGNLADVDFTSDSEGWVVGWKDRLYRTTNGGKTWKWVTALGTAVFSDIAFSSDEEGYVNATVNSSINALKRTTDGGKTWSLQKVTKDEVDSIATTGSVDYLLSNETELLFTTTGGSAGSNSTLSLKTKKTSLSSPKKITINGTLNPGVGGREVIVSFFAAGASSWVQQTAKTSSSGTFSVKVSVKRGANYVVAQWAGDESRNGCGTKPLVVNVG